MDAPAAFNAHRTAGAGLSAGAGAPAERVHRMVGGENFGVGAATSGGGGTLQADSQVIPPATRKKSCGCFPTWLSKKPKREKGTAGDPPFLGCVQRARAKKTMDTHCFPGQNDVYATPCPDDHINC